jgi:hypothetical protein
VEEVVLVGLGLGSSAAPAKMFPLLQCLQILDFRIAEIPVCGGVQQGGMLIARIELDMLDA